MSETRVQGKPSGGNWRYDPENRDVLGFCGDGREHVLAALLNHGPREYTDETGAEWYYPETDANGRLMAAAPRMRDALLVARDALAMAVVDDVMGSAHAYEVVRAAIAAATEVTP